MPLQVCVLACAFVRECARVVERSCVCVWGGGKLAEKCCSADKTPSLNPPNWLHQFAYIRTRMYNRGVVSLLTIIISAGTRISVIVCEQIKLRIVILEILFLVSPHSALGGDRLIPALPFFVLILYYLF